MPNKAHSKQFSHSRAIAFSRQGGRCFYCRCLMWLGNPLAFCQLYGLKPKQVKPLQCTGEHLLPRHDGGKDEPDNIAAACALCNRRRHKRKNPPAPDTYGEYVRRRVAKHAWHSPWVFAQGLLPSVGAT